MEKIDIKKQRNLSKDSTKLVTKVGQGKYLRKNIKKILALLSIVTAVITIYQIASTYALFYSEGAGEVNSQIARWEIVINNQDIVSETIQSFSVNSLEIDNASATNGKLSPGMEGSFNIVIEPNTTQVSVRYDINIDNTNMEGTDINLISVTETEEGNVITRTGENTYTGIIPLASINSDYADHIKITFKWIEDGSGGSEDIEFEDVENPIIEVPISVKVSQYLGEEITEW